MGWGQHDGSRLMWLLQRSLEGAVAVVERRGLILAFVMPPSVENVSWQVVVPRHFLKQFLIIVQQLLEIHLLMPITR